MVYIGWLFAGIWKNSIFFLGGKRWNGTCRGKKTNINWRFILVSDVCMCFFESSFVIFFWRIKECHCLRLEWWVFSQYLVYDLSIICICTLWSLEMIIVEEGGTTAYLDNIYHYEYTSIAWTVRAVCTCLYCSPPQPSNVQTLLIHMSVISHMHSQDFVHKKRDPPKLN